ncbi:MAG: polyamine aminopropyltransferase [Gammaproteobacteria bacterium]
MIDQKDWFTEQITDAGAAFSLKIVEKLHEEQSEYQHIEIYRTEKFGNLMVIDGCIMLSDRDNFIYHEMMSHPVLFSHPAPKKVWIIGGGDCGTLKEVLKHDGVESVVQIDIDERVTRLAEKYFPVLCSSNDDPRAELKFIDGIRWVKEAAPGSVDIIIVDSTDPVGPAEGLFTREFFENCLNCLTGDGIVVQQSESPLYHMDILEGMHQAMRSAGFADTQTIFFPQCVYPSGWWSATLAGKNKLDAFRESAAREKTFDTDYYTADIHRAAQACPAFFKRMLNSMS